MKLKHEVKIKYVTDKLILKMRVIGNWMVFGVNMLTNRDS